MKYVLVCNNNCMKIDQLKEIDLALHFELIIWKAIYECFLI